MRLQPLWRIIHRPRLAGKAMSERRGDESNNELVLLGVLVFLIAVVIWRAVVHLTGH